MRFTVSQHKSIYNPSYCTNWEYNFNNFVLSSIQKQLSDNNSFCLGYFGGIFINLLFTPVPFQDFLSFGMC